MNEQELADLDFEVAVAEGVADSLEYRAMEGGSFVRPSPKQKPGGPPIYEVYAPTRDRAHAMLLWLGMRVKSSYDPEQMQWDINGIRHADPLVAVCKAYVALHRAKAVA